MRIESRMTRMRLSVCGDAAVLGFGEKRKRRKARSLHVKAVESPVRPPLVHRSTPPPHGRRI